MFRNSNKDLSDKESGEESGDEEIVNESPKKNKLSLWGEVLNDQILSSGLGMQCGVDKILVERSVESYHVPFVREPRGASYNSSKHDDEDSNDNFESTDDDIEDNNKRKKISEEMKQRLGTKKSLKDRLGERKVLVSEELKKKHPISERLGNKERRRRRKDRFNVILTLEDATMQALESCTEVSSFIKGLLEAFKEPATVKPIFENAIETVGLEEGKKLLKQTQQVQLEGGMLTLDGSRKRSIGGVFLQLLKSVTNKQQQAKIFQNNQKHYYNKYSKNKFKNNKNNGKNSKKNSNNDEKISANNNSEYADNIFLTKEIPNGDASNDKESTNATVENEKVAEDGELMNVE